MVNDHLEDFAIARAELSRAVAQHELEISRAFVSIEELAAELRATESQHARVSPKNDELKVREARLGMVRELSQRSTTSAAETADPQVDLTQGAAPQAARPTFSPQLQRLRTEL